MVNAKFTIFNLFIVIARRALQESNAANTLWSSTKQSQQALIISKQIRESQWVSTTICSYSHRLSLREERFKNPMQLTHIEARRSNPNQALIISKQIRESWWVFTYHIVHLARECRDIPPLNRAFSLIIMPIHLSLTMEPMPPHPAAPALIHPIPRHVSVFPGF